MQVAEILSDLTSLRVCDYNDALALVTVHERIPAELSPADSGLAVPSQQSEKANDDLQRAKELVDLHYEIKARHADGTVDEELARAREDVNRVLMELGH
ncbi:hypothetical protein BDV32DRAFT_125759 [Aspergillus pseudonomiae]|uniref:Uncharacterized protein n=1 Tax=Aspergillus pseudonomiae TaxID=1506151 RepID=A0A5N7DLJ3_9EURO|nr:uncharacterized protein BDV37DRAFT_241504 [Aspergillus pseudonomiae]KAB8258414.1 hypothetical protein BDV32DRAFT_125759 [Aspergillus pseudonomiae]KAE8407312.1 hypothetical protein BDV37DRAFT_241504 [Aspergillus pseudonomiae]